MQKTTKYSLIIGILAALAIVMSIYARFSTQFPGDLYLIQHLQSFNNRFLLSLMQWVSFIFGGWCAVVVLVVIGILVWWRLGRLEAILFPAAGILTQVDPVLKLLIGRARPSADLVQILLHMQDNGFPSGHAIFAIMILGLLAYFIFINLKNHILRTMVLTVLIALIMLIGTSRVYLGLHWPSDVIGGYIIGGALLAALIWFYRIRKVNH